MRAQIAFSRSSTFQTFFTGLFSLEIQDLGRWVQGVVIDIHPVWRGLWDFYQSTGASPDIHFYDPFLCYWPIAMIGNGSGIGAPDTDWICESWIHFIERSKKKAGGALIVKICTRAMLPDAPERRALQAYADGQPFFCVLEERAPARALAAVQGGGGVTTGLSRGTLGGFLKDQDGNVYGLTCAHVAMASTATFDLHDVAGSTLSAGAKIAHTSFPNLLQLTPGQLCNRAGTGGQVPDVALLNLDPVHAAQSSVRAIGTIDDILDENALGSGSSVVLRGGVSGYHSAYIGAYSVVYNVLFEDGNEYCFDHMFEVITHRASAFAALIPPALTSKPVNGDSGAWICAPSRKTVGNYGFAGMLTAGDGSNAYVCFADAIQRWASTTHGINLVPL